MFDMIGGVGVGAGGVEGLLGRMVVGGRWVIQLHLRMHTLSISKFKFKSVLVKLICRISKYNF